MRGVPLRYSFRNLFRRPMRTVLTLIGLSLLVGLIVFVGAFGRSIAMALRMPGDPQNLMVFSKKAQSLEFGSIAPETLATLRNDVIDDIDRGPDGQPLFSREVFAFTNVRFTDDAKERGPRGIVLGIEAALAPHVLAGFRLLEGRMPQADEYEIAVGRGAPAKMRVDDSLLAIGSQVFLRNEVFTVVGRFETPGAICESWLLTAPNDLKLTTNRSDFSIARMKVRPGVDLDALARKLEEKSFEVHVIRETVYNRDFISGFRRFQSFSILLALVLALGGVITGMITMHNAVAGRIREIGILRVLGFNKTKILIAFLIEAVSLSLAAGILGSTVGWLTNGLPIQVPFAASFPLVVDWPMAAIGVGTAVLMGVLGLLFPILKALRHHAVDAMRAV